MEALLAISLIFGFALMSPNSFQTLHQAIRSFSWMLRLVLFVSSQQHCVLFRLTRCHLYAHASWCECGNGSHPHLGSYLSPSSALRAVSNYTEGFLTSLGLKNLNQFWCGCGSRHLLRNRTLHHIHSFHVDTADFTSFFYLFSFFFVLQYAAAIFGLSCFGYASSSHQSCHHSQLTSSVTNCLQDSTIRFDCISFVLDLDFAQRHA